MHIDHREYIQYTGRSRLEKSINSLLGLVEGLVVDSRINNAEVEFLELWLEEHQDLKGRHPYNELIPVVERAVADAIVTSDEKQDILWLCERLRSNDYFDAITADIQRLHAILGGIAADGQITEGELRGLSDWLTNHDHLKTCWPYEEVESLIVGVLRDKKIDPTEQKVLKAFFTDFLAILDDRTIVRPRVSINGSINGLCAVCPEITVSGRQFCLTGASHRYTRAEFARVIEEFGGRVMTGINKQLDYLIIGSEGNPCWAYTCYGRKVEKAVELRKAGSSLLIVHENDFHDAIADLEVA